MIRNLLVMVGSFQFGSILAGRIFKGRVLKDYPEVMKSVEEYEKARLSKV